MQFGINGTNFTGMDDGPSVVGRRDLFRIPGENATPRANQAAAAAASGSNRIAALRNGGNPSGRPPL